MCAWSKTKQDGKDVFDKGWGLFEKLGGPVNRLSNKMGCEAFFPMTLDHECDKSARILKSFCEDGFYTEQPSRPGSSPGPRINPRVLVKIPQRVIQNCVGLAIFTVMRTGMWISGAGGSGVLIARKEDGSWSPPSGLLVHTLGVGFMAGIDIYDCVVVINNRSALEAFSKVRVSLGGEISVVAGPLGVGGILESEVTKDRRPVFSYVKSRGFYAGAQLDGTVIVERNDENARFYGQQLPIGEILKGNVRRIPQETRMLMQVLRDIDARTGVGRGAPMTMREPTPSDMEIQKMDEQTKMDEQMKIDEQVKMDEQMAMQMAMEMQYAPPPTYEEVHSTNSLYSPPSPVQSQRQSESFTPQFPAEGSAMASVSSPPLPPRPSSLNGDSENSKLG